MGDVAGEAMNEACLWCAMSLPWITIVCDPLFLISPLAQLQTQSLWQRITAREYVFCVDHFLIKILVAILLRLSDGGRNYVYMDMAKPSVNLKCHCLVWFNSKSIAFSCLFLLLSYFFQQKGHHARIEQLGEDSIFFLVTAYYVWYQCSGSVRTVNLPSPTLDWNNLSPSKIPNKKWKKHTKKNQIDFSNQSFPVLPTLFEIPSHTSISNHLIR